MDENQQKLIDLANELIQKANSQEIDPRLPLSDGSGNIIWPNVREVLTSDEYASFRNQPGVKEILEKSQMFRNVSGAGIVAQNTSQLALGIEQLRRGNNVNVTPPGGVAAQPRSEDLGRAVSESFALSRMGLTPEERALAMGEINRSAETFRRQATAASGGQASAQQSSAQQGALMRSRSVAQLARESARQRQQAGALLTQQLGLQEQESSRIDRMGQFNFAARDMPVWNRNLLERDRLQGAGIANTFGASTAYNDMLQQLSQQYGSSMPGYALPNTRFGDAATGDEDVDAVVEASQLAASMNTSLPKDFQEPYTLRDKRKKSMLQNDGFYSGPMRPTQYGSLSPGAGAGVQQMADRLSDPALGTRFDRDTRINPYIDQRDQATDYLLRQRGF